MNSNEDLTTRRPYFIKAIYQWIIDNNLTPHLLVNAKYKDTKVPHAHITENGTIVLNIAPVAIRNMDFGLQHITFNAAFPGLKADIFLPMASIKAIYAIENGEGMVFKEELDGNLAKETSLKIIKNTEKTAEKKKKPSSKPPIKLEIVKK